MVQELRVVVFGDLGVGKSTLSVQFMQNIFVAQLDPTIEDSYRKQIVVDDLPCVLDVLDTAGPEEFSCLWPQYIHRSHGFLLVFSLTNRCSLDQICTHHETILKVKDMSTLPMIMVGNKSDLVDEREVSDDEAKNLACDMKIPYFEVSAKMDVNVVECFVEIVKLIRLSPYCPTGQRTEKPKKVGCQIA